jgi:hypothetical protein
MGKASCDNEGGRRRARGDACGTKRVRVGLESGYVEGPHVVEQCTDMHNIVLKLRNDAV